MEEAFVDAMVVGYEDRFAAISLPDPKDWHVVAAAVATGADIIATENLKHFPTALMRRFGLEARPADAVIADAIALDLNRSLGAIRAMRAAFRNPSLTAESLLLKMDEQGLAESARILRPHLHSL